MKIGIVWDNGVSKWMAQMFEPLADINGADATLFVGEKNKHDVKDIKLKMQRLTHREEILLGAARPAESIGRLVGAPFKKMDFYYNSLGKYLEGMDVVESSEASRTLYTAACLKKRGMRFKLIMSCAENIPYRQVFDDKSIYVKRSCYGAVDHFIPWCDTIKKTMLLEGFPEEKITTVYTGLDTELFKPVDRDAALLREFDVPAGDMVILYVGKLATWKGVQMLPYAAKALLQRGYKAFTFLIAGKGAQFDNIQKIIKEAGIERHFRYAGFVPYMEMRRLYSSADIFVMPSFPTMLMQEQFGMVLVEAMACKVPPVASATGSIPEIVGDAGLTFIPGDFFGLADKIAFLMDNAALRKELGEKGRRRSLAHFDAKKNALKIYGIYEKALACPRVPSAGGGK
ncbi:MAG: glycosyltransferase family 4 protein [Deltaproteobacteria bacterium]|nr:glycosyltransferase family 4 protein [Deltaproteobacteria bacterium]